MRFAICNEIFKGWTLSDTIKFVKATGYDALEIAPFTLAPFVTDITREQRNEIVALAAQENLEISGIHWVLVQTEGLHLTHRDAAVQEKTADYFTELVHFCGDIGGRTIVVGSPKQRNLCDGMTAAEGVSIATKIFQDAVRAAEERGVTICIEPLSPQETNFLNTAEQAIEFIRPFNSRAMRIILDVKAMCSEEKSIPEIIGDSKGRFAYFHANDRNLKGPGFGDVDFGPIAAALKQAAYEGFVSVEVFNFDEGPEAIAERSLDYLKRKFA